MKYKHSKGVMRYGRFLIYFVAAAFILFVFMQGYNSLFKQTPVRIATRGTAVESFNTEGVIFMDETLVYAAGGDYGTLSYKAYDGEKVAKNSIVAALYDSQEDIDTRNRIYALEREIDSYKVVNPGEMTGSMDIVANDLLLEKNIQLVIDYNNSGKYLMSSRLKDDIRLLVNRRRYITGAVASFDDKIAQLTREKETLQSSLKDVLGDVTASRGGYFVRSADGYEEMLSPEYTMQSYDVSALEDLKNKEVAPAPNNVIGKIIAGFDFYYCAVTDAKTAEQLKVGQAVELRFFSKGDTLFPATVANVSDQYNGKRVIQFRSKQMAQGFDLQRFGGAQVILKTYSGILVPQSAVRVVDGVQGVYILVGSQAKLRTVTPLYFDGENYIVEQDNEKNKALLLGDQIIISGTELYDGKILK